MKNCLYNKKEDKLFQKIQKKKKSLRRNNSIELSKNFKEYLLKEKSKPNNNDYFPYKKIKLFNKNLIMNKTSYQNIILSHSNSANFLIYSGGNSKTKNGQESFYKLIKKMKINQDNKNYKKTFLDCSTRNINDISNYKIYLKNDFQFLNFYKNFDLKLNKSKNFNRKYDKNKNYIKNNWKLTPNRKDKHIFLKSNYSSKSLINNKKDYLREYKNKYTNIYNQKKIIEYNSKNKSEGRPIPHIVSDELEKNNNIKKEQFSSFTFSKKKLQNLIYQKIKNKENLSVEYDKNINNNIDNKNSFNNNKEENSINSNIDERNSIYYNLDSKNIINNNVNKKNSIIINNINNSDKKETIISINNIDKNNSINSNYNISKKNSIIINSNYNMSKNNSIDNNKEKKTINNNNKIDKKNNININNNIDKKNSIYINENSEEKKINNSNNGFDIKININNNVNKKRKIIDINKNDEQKKNNNNIEQKKTINNNNKSNKNKNNNIDKKNSINKKNSIMSYNNIMHNNNIININKIDEKKIIDINNNNDKENAVSNYNKIDKKKSINSFIDKKNSFNTNNYVRENNIISDNNIDNNLKNNNIKTSDYNINDNYFSINNIEKNINNYINNKNESIYSDKDLSREEKLKLNHSSNEINNSNITKKTINSDSFLEQKNLLKDSIKNTPSKITKKLNVHYTPKIRKKENKYFTKIPNFYEDSPKNKMKDSTKENVQDVNQIERAVPKINEYSNKKSTKNFVSVASEIGETKIKIFRKSAKFKTVMQKKKITFNVFSRKKIRFLSIKGIKKIKDGKKEKSFLKDIIDINSAYNKFSILNSILKRNKISFLSNQKNYIEYIISKQNEKLNSSVCSLDFNFNNNGIETMKNDFIKIHNEKKKKYKNIYFEIMQDSLLYILVCSDMKHIFKCDLQGYAIDYLLFNNALSTIFVPIVDITRKSNAKRNALFVKDKLHIVRKELSLFEDKKSKFVENRDQEIFDRTSVHFIYKEFCNLYLDSKNTNYLEKYNLFAKFQRKGTKSKARKDRSSWRKKVMTNNISIYSNNSTKRLSFFNRDYIQSPVRRRFDKLSILQNGNIFEMAQNQKEKIIESIKNIKKVQRKRILKHKRIQRRLSSRHSIAYYDLIQKITKKDKSILILKNLIKEGEELLFLEYINNKSRNIDINSLDHDGNSFLILCVKQHLNMLSKILLDKGIDINIQNNEGNTALHYALSSKNFEMADILRKYGALENCVNKLGYTPWDCIGKNIEFDEIY